MPVRLERILTRFDWLLLMAAAALMAVGLVVMYGIGISQTGSSLFLFQKQVVGAGIGALIVLALIFIDYKQLRGLALPIYAIGLSLLIGVLIFGSNIRGTKGWFVIGGLSFQPVEPAKICLILFLAAYLVRFVHRKITMTALVGSFLATVVYAGLVMFQPDFGSALVMLAIWALMVLCLGIRFRVLVGAALIAALASVFAWNVVLQPYQKSRFIAFINPAADIRGAGYNVYQAGIAIGSGGFFGKGIGEGSQSRLRFLPEAATDFTFAVVGEELGFVGISFVLGLFILLFYRFYRIAELAEDDFASLILIGIGALFLIHLTVSIGMNLGLMPVTGIPLPFLSAASSFLIIVFLALGLTESISVHRVSHH